MVYYIQVISKYNIGKGVRAMKKTMKFKLVTRETTFVFKAKYKISKETELLFDRIKEDEIDGPELELLLVTKRIIDMGYDFDKITAILPDAYGTYYPFTYTYERIMLNLYLLNYHQMTSDKVLNIKLIKKKENDSDFNKIF